MASALFPAVPVMVAVLVPGQMLMLLTAGWHPGPLLAAVLVSEAGSVAFAVHPSL